MTTRAYRQCFGVKLQRRAQADLAKPRRRVLFYNSTVQRSRLKESLGDDIDSIVSCQRTQRFAIPAFDVFLAGRSLRFEAVILGGSALALLGVVTRTNDDCDLLDPEFPTDVTAPARDFAAVSGIVAGWPNSKAHDLVAIPGCVPEGRRTQLRVSFTGTSLHLLTLGHLDLLCTKLAALVDRGIDYQDCVALNPSLAELRAAWPFVEQYEDNADSREKYCVPLARRQLMRLAKELGYDAVF
jgi:hypothetical protein